MSAEGKITPPDLPDTGLETVVFDDGVAGEWLRMLRNSPCLKVSDYPGCRLPDGDGLAPARSFHDPSSSGEDQQDVAA
jgi:hypothetical protein